MGNKILMRTGAVHERIRRTPGLVGTFSKFGSLSGVVPSLDGDSIQKLRVGHHGRKSMDNMALCGSTAGSQSVQRISRLDGCL